MKELFTEKLNNMILKCNTYLLFLLSFLIIGCEITHLQGFNSRGHRIFSSKSFENNSGNNVGSIFEPGLDRDFTIALQNILENQTNLEMLQSNGDLVYEGEIIEYRVSPMTATANLDAAQNRLTITINVIFSNLKREEDNFERRFSFYYDFPAEQQLISIKNEAHDIIFERITQDIFNASLAKW